MQVVKGRAQKGLCSEHLTKRRCPGGCGWVGAASDEERSPGALEAISSLGRRQLPALLPLQWVCLWYICFCWWWSSSREPCLGLHQPHAESVH